MVDTSTVLERAISALKRSQRFRDVSDEVRAAEELDKQRLEKHNFIKTHALRKMTDEEVERMIGVRQPQVPSATTGGVGPTPKPAAVSKVPPIIKKSPRTYPRVKAGKPVPIGVTSSRVSGRDRSSASISSPTPSSSSVSASVPQRRSTQPGPKPKSPASRRHDSSAELQEPQTQSEPKTEPDLSTMSQISTYKSSIHAEKGEAAPATAPDSEDDISKRVQSIGAIFEAAAAAKVDKDDEPRSASIDDSESRMSTLQTASELRSRSRVKTRVDTLNTASSLSTTPTLTEGGQGQPSPRRRHQPQPQGTPTRDLPLEFEDYLGPSPKQAEAMKVEYRKALNKLRQKRDRERGFDFTPLPEARSTDKLVKSLGEYYRKSKAEAEAAAKAESSAADRSNMSTLSGSFSRVSERESKSKSQMDTANSTATDKSIHTIYDASTKSKSKSVSGGQREDRGRNSRNVSESIATYSDTFEEPSASDPATSKSKSMTSSAPKNQSKSGQPGGSFSQSKRSQVSSKKASDRKSVAKAPVPDKDENSHSYAFAHRTPSEDTKPPSSPVPVVPARLMRISPELGQELSSIMENLQSMSTTTTENRTAAPSPRARRPAPPDSPEVTYTQDFLSDHEAEFIHELKNVGVKTTAEKPNVNTVARRGAPAIPTARTTMAVGRVQVPGKVLAFPPGIEPNLDHGGYLMQPIQRQVIGGGGHPQSKTDFYTKFLTEVVESNERMYNATVEAAKGMAKVYHKQQQQKQERQKMSGHAQRQRQAKKESKDKHKR